LQGDHYIGKAQKNINPTIACALNGKQISNKYIPEYLYHYDDIAPTKGPVTRGILRRIKKRWEHADNNGPKTSTPFHMDQRGQDLMDFFLVH